MDRRAVAFALALVLAGCGSVASGGPETATETLTPAPVPEVTEPEPTLPPGVTGDGVPDAAALYSAHTDYLQGRSYTLRVRVRVDDTRTSRTVRVETPTRYLSRDRLPRRNFTRFADGERLYIRTDIGSNRLFAGSGEVEAPTAYTVRLSKAFLQLDDARVAETRVDGEPAYELTGEYPVHPAVDTLHNVTVRAVLSPEGFIRSLNVTYVSVGPGTGTNVTREFAYTDVDATTVERPAWVDREFNDTDSETGTIP